VKVNREEHGRPGDECRRFPSPHLLRNCGDTTGGTPGSSKTRRRAPRATDGMRATPGRWAQARENARRGHRRQDTTMHGKDQESSGASWQTADIPGVVRPVGRQAVMALVNADVGERRQEQGMPKSRFQAVSNREPIGPRCVSSLFPHIPSRSICTLTFLITPRSHASGACQLAVL